MKTLIVPATIILALIVFFVVIERKEFHRQEVQSVSPTIIRKPTGSFPRTIPVTEVNPAVETEPIDTESIDTTRNRPVVDMKPDEPFSEFYQDCKPESFCFQGTIRATSTIPDPKKNDYDNCMYALFVEIDALLSAVPADNEIACEAIVNVPIMKNKTILRNNIFYPGDKVLCTCAEYDAMPQRIQEIQLSDDIQSYEHQQYFSFEIRRIESFQKDGNRNFAKRTITILPIQTLPRDENARALRKERMQNEIARIQEEIKKHGGSFDKWKEEYKSIDEKYKKLSSEGYKGWINDCYFATSSRNPDPTYKTKDYIKGILPYKKYLEENNIDLIVVRVPYKFEFARCVLASDVFQESPLWMEHYYECLKNDIEILDPMPEMWNHRFDFPLFYFYNEPSDSHPFEGQAFISAKVISEILKERYPYPTSDKTIQLEDFSPKSSSARYHWPAGNEKFNPKDNVTFKRVICDDKPIGGLSVNTGSPFLFLSNSYFKNPWREGGASVPAYTAFFIQHIPDWFYQSGVGNPMIRNLIANHQTLSNRKAVIMVGHPQFWRGSFPPFPKYLLDDAKTISQEKTIDFLSSDIKIIDDDSFVFSKDEQGLTHFIQNENKEKASNSFRIELNIPYIEGKDTCMIRVNYESNSYITMVVRDPKSKDILDQTKISTGTNQHPDFYIPISGNDRLLSIEFNPSYPKQDFSIKNIEFWYY